MCIMVNQGRLLFRVFSLLLLLGGLCGCPNSATRPTPVFGDVQLGVTASLSGSSGAALQLAGTDLIIDEALVNFRRIDLKPDNVADPGVEYEGPFVVNVVDGGNLLNQETPAFQIVSVPIDTYSEIEFRIDPIRRTEIPDGLAFDNTVTTLLPGNAIVIEGRFTESSTNDIDKSGGVSSIPFRFLSDMGTDLQLDIPDKFSITDGDRNFIFMALRLKAWFVPALSRLQGLTAADLTEGRILLSPSSQSAAILDLVDLIEDGVRGGEKFAEGEDDLFEEGEVDEESFSEIDFDDIRDGTLGAGVEVVSGQFFLNEVRMNVDAFILNQDSDLTFGGPFVLSLVANGEMEEVVVPSFEDLGIPTGNYDNLEVTFQELSSFDVPGGISGDGIVTDLLVDNTFAIIGNFLESPTNDIDQDGGQSFVPFTLVSDDFFNAFVDAGVTEDIGAVLFPLVDPTLWFNGALPLLQGLDPSLLEGGEFFLSDSSSSAAIRDLVGLVEANLETRLP